MSDRSNSRWRWILLGVMAVLLCVRLVMWPYWVYRSALVGGGGPPAVVVNLTPFDRTIVKWDWNTNRMEPIATFDRGPIAGMLCAGDGKFVWYVDGTLHTVDLEPPHEHRRWKTSFPGSDDSNYVRLVGASENSRLVVVQWVRPVGPSTGNYEADLLVIDPNTGEEVSTKHWHSDIHASDLPGEFKSYCRLPGGATANEPAAGEWRLTDDGAWALLPPNRARPSVAEITNDGAGGYRGLSDDELLSRRVLRQGTLKGLSPDGKHVLRTVGNFQLCLSHVGRRDVQVLPITFSHVLHASFTVDGKHVVAGDVYGDLHVFDAVTGRTVARTWSAARWYRLAGGLAAAFLVCAVGLTFLAFREERAVWAIVDLHAAAMAAQMAFFSFQFQLENAFPGAWRMVAFDIGVAPAATAAFGIAVGWYWAYGRSAIVVRLAWGVLSILAIGCVPAIALATMPPIAYVAIRLVLPPFAGLFAASVTAVLLSPTGMLGWRASDEPLPFGARRFSLASAMILIAGVSVALAFPKLLSGNPGGLDVRIFGMAIVSTAVAGLLLPAIAIMNVGRPSRILLGAGVAGLVMVGMAVGIYQRPTSSSQWIGEVAVSIFAAATGTMIVGMAMLARKHGWRWRKAQALASEFTLLEAAG